MGQAWLWGALGNVECRWSWECLLQLSQGLCCYFVLLLARRCVPFLHALAAITPNAHELLEIANAVQARHGLPPLQQPAAAVVSEQHSSATPQQLLAQIAPAAAVVLQQGGFG